MTEQEIALARLQQDAALERERIKADVRKVIYGTFLLGVAVALFPVISGYIEHSFNLRIEATRQVNALALQANQLKLDLQKLERESRLAVEAASAAALQSDRTFFESIADEARSARLSDRITIAEFFAYVAREDAERARWLEFLQYLQAVQEMNNTRRSALLLIIQDSSLPEAERAAAARELAQIDERESGVASAKTDTRWLKDVLVPSREATGSSELSLATTDDLIGLLGVPHSAPNQDCQAPDNQRLLDLIETRSVGPFSAALIRPALASLERVLAEVQKRQPDLFSEVGTTGGLCVRQVRGGTGRFSNHSWGISVDLTVGGRLPAFGKETVPEGMAELAKYFAREGWVWGGHFARPDGMHFEVSAQKLAEWNAAGLLSP